MSDLLLGLEGHKALIIGGGQGMGEASAMRLAAAGCDIAIVDIIAERAERVATEVTKSGRRGVTGHRQYADGCRSAWWALPN